MPVAVVYVRLESPVLARNFKSALDLTFTRTYTCEWTECQATGRNVCSDNGCVENDLGASIASCID